MIEILLMLFFAVALIPCAALIVTDMKYEEYLKNKYKWKAKR